MEKSVICVSFACDNETMSQTLSRPATEILAKLQSLVERIHTTPSVPNDRDYHEVHRWHYFARREYAEWGVEVRELRREWIGLSESAAERKRFHRAIQELVDAGAVVRFARWGDKTTHVRLPEPETAP